MNRRGFSLAEVLVALGLAAGPLLVAVGLIHSNVKGSRHTVELASARLALVDLSETLVELPLAELRALDGTRVDLAARLRARMDGLPAPVAAAYRDQLAALAGPLTAKLAEDVGHPGLARLTLALGGATTVTVVRHFRPEAFERGEE